jgi:predicted nucleotidyltransferase
MFDSPELVDRRLKGNEMSKKIMPKAVRVSKFIGKFPYVESVCLSGALSKGYFDDNGDIDFFIITNPSRLWIARTLLILYKKIFLLNSNKYFCVNYFISTDQLEITEKNRFTATELLTLIPICGPKVFESFIEANSWTKSFLPNAVPHNRDNLKDISKPWLTNNFETLCNFTFGTGLDEIFRRITLKKWNSKFKNMKKADFDIALKSTQTVSKHHPNNFQKKVINTVNNKYHEVIIQYNLELIREDA